MIAVRNLEGSSDKADGLLGHNGPHGGESLMHLRSLNAGHVDPADGQVLDVVLRKCCSDAAVIFENVNLDGLGTAESQDDCLSREADVELGLGCGVQHGTNHVEVLV